MSRSSRGRRERMRSLACLAALIAVTLTWSAVSAGAAMAAVAPNQVAPSLRSDGQTLRWGQVSNVSNYVLATKAPGKATTYRTVPGTSFTPPTVPNASVTYGLRTDVAGSTWATEVAISYVTVSNTTAPTLQADGQTLRWNQVASVTSYVLATKVPGAATTYRTVSGTSTTPAAVSGTTVGYGLRTNVPSSNWAVEASIAYPAGPVEPPVQPGSGMRMGIAANSDFATTDMMNKHQAMGSPPVRYDATPTTDFSTGSQDALIDNFSSRGIRPLAILSFRNAYPSESTVERFCRTYANRFGPSGSFWQTRSYPASVRPIYIEFGNETSYSYMSNTYQNPEQYARLFKVCASAAAATNTGMKVLAQADDPSGVNWVSRMYSAVPELNTLVGGWTSHPYGPESRSDGILNKVRDQTAARGSSAPILVTEWGLSTDNGRCLNNNYTWPTCMTYVQARDALVGTMTRWKLKYPRLKEVYYFQTRDQRPSGSTEREYYFGLLTNGGTPKGVLYDAYVDYVRRGI